MFVSLENVQTMFLIVQFNQRQTQSNLALTQTLGYSSRR